VRHLVDGALFSLHLPPYNLGTQMRACANRFTRDAHVRAAAALARSRCGPESWVALVPLTEALSDRSAIVRAAAAEALGRLGAGARPAVPALAVAWRGRKSFTRRQHLMELIRQADPPPGFSPRPSAPHLTPFHDLLNTDAARAAAEALMQIDSSYPGLPERP
jgi:HEAT repeat protein